MFAELFAESRPRRLLLRSLAVSSMFAIVAAGCTGIKTGAARSTGGSAGQDPGSGGRTFGTDAATDFVETAGRDATLSSDLPPPTEDASCSHEIQAVVRDFRGANGGTPDGPRHPDFEGQFTSYKGIVQEMLGADNKPVYAPAGKTVGSTGKAEFDQWYRDVDGTNIRFDDIRLPLTEDPARPGHYVYDDQSYFPIDNRGFGDGFQANNFHFTTEIHLDFPYRGGEVLTFKGDDDLFLFVNGHLAIDLGGVHPAQEGTVDLDAQSTNLTIEKGKTYRMDIFQAERHTSESHFRLETTLQCFTSVIIP